MHPEVAANMHAAVARLKMSIPPVACAAFQAGALGEAATARGQPCGRAAHLDVEARLGAGLDEVDIELPGLGVALLHRHLPAARWGVHHGRGCPWMQVHYPSALSTMAYLPPALRHSNMAHRAPRQTPMSLAVVPSWHERPSTEVRHQRTQHARIMCTLTHARDLLTAMTSEQGLRCHRSGLWHGQQQPKSAPTSCPPGRFCFPQGR
jgi:hypothetical protein